MINITSLVKIIINLIENIITCIKQLSNHIVHPQSIALIMLPLFIFCNW